MPILELVRKANFSASHRLHAEDLSDEENAAFFGKCNRLLSSRLPTGLLYEVELRETQNNVVIFRGGY
jgi:6-pyruvoyl-tetrahydropterin synthase